MVPIPSGSFIMGIPYEKPPYITPKDDPFTSIDEVKEYEKNWQKNLKVVMAKAGADSTNSPAHKVTLSGFTMSTTEVTQFQYYSVMGENPSFFKTEELGYDSRNNPVECVKYSDARTFCNKLSVKDGKQPVYLSDGAFSTNYDGYIDNRIDRTANGYRLPTEAEWEYACRGGSITSWYWGDDTIGIDQDGNQIDLIDQNVWHGKELDNTYRTNPVGQKKPNAYGLYDMNGNVTEFCSDARYTYTEESVTNPYFEGMSAVCRGGSYWSKSVGFKVTSRELCGGNLGQNHEGFRIVQQIQTENKVVPNTPKKRHFGDRFSDIIIDLYNSSK